MAITYHAVKVQSPSLEGNVALYAVVGLVDNASESNPNFVFDLTNAYTRAETLANSLNGS